MFFFHSLADSLFFISLSLCFQEYFEAKTMEEGMIEIDHEDHQPVYLPDGQTLNVVMAIPFLDINPLGATE